MLEAIAILGPTASGKSSLALRLAECLNGEIINADALQVYQGLDLGTAKPSLSEQESVAHHLIDILHPRQAFSAGEFSRLAREKAKEVRQRGHLPILVGGSGLYLRALFQGMSPLPATNPQIREALQDRLQSEGLASLEEELRRIDPATAARLAPGDRQRVLRALEVFEISGSTLSKWIADRPFDTAAFSALKVGLTLPRGILYDRIQSRALCMFEKGWVREVRELLGSGMQADWPAFQAIGYRQICQYLCGESPLRAVFDQIVQATRRFAKRQITWFRKEPEIRWFSNDHTARLTDEVLRFLQRSGVGGE